MDENTQRFYVGNLPDNVTEKDLIQEFQFYGKVHNIELKTKANLTNPDVPIKFAFLSLDIDKRSAERCIQEFRSQTFRGVYLNVSFAKESFLERLKREREEAAQKTNAVKELSKSFDNTDKIIQQSTLPKLTSSKNVSDCSTDSETDSAETRNLNSPHVNKFKQDNKAPTRVDLSHATRNIPLRIESTDIKPIHIIQKNLKERKRLDKKGEIADSKRKLGLKKMQNEYSKQKLLIQSALSRIDSKSSQKIVFHNESDDETKKKISLNLDIDAEEMSNINTGFSNKEKLRGNQGADMLEMQFQSNLDPRFNMDDRFLLDNATKSVPETENEHNIREEREWQIGIMEEVIGQKVNMKDISTKKTQDQIFRFDPANSDHQQFLKNSNAIKVKNEKLLKQESVVTKTASKNTSVCSEQYYNVTENLTKALQENGNEFSLLTQFGQITTTKNLDKDFKEVDYKEVIMPHSKKKPEKDFFHILIEEDKDNMNTAQIQTQDNFSKPKTGKHGILHETFFIFNKDGRLKEGAMFFHLNKDKTDASECYDKTRRNLGILINRKIGKAKKNQNGRRYFKHKKNRT